MSLPGEFSSPEYDILEVLGQGSQALVYKARSKSDGQIVAIKVISPQGSKISTFQKRFLREMQVARRLDHPHVVRALNTGIDLNDDIYFAVLEYVEGQSLGECLADEGKIPLDLSLKIVEKVGYGLHHAHENGLIHRDVKPDNILIGKDGSIKITDFGLVKPINDSSGLTSTGTLVGTPLYLAPEQVKLKTIDHRADIYSLGITLFQILTGRPPFDYRHPLEVVEAHCFEKMPSARNFVPSLPRSVDDFIIQMTEKNPENRFENALEMSLKARSLLTSPEVSKIKENPAASTVSLNILSLVRERGTFETVRTPGNLEKTAKVDRGSVSRQLNLLVVDRDEGVHNVVRSFVEDMFTSLEVISALSGKAALDSIRSHRPELLLIEVNLPDMMGTDLCRNLRKDSTLSTAPILLMTSNMSKGLRDEGYLAGADDFLFKPLSFLEVKNKLQRMMSQLK